MFDLFGSKVRIKRTVETERKGLAGMEGEVYGQTTPSIMSIEVVGTLTEDVAINVHFDDLNKSCWFATDLVEYLDNGQAGELRFDGIDKRIV